MEVKKKKKKHSLDMIIAGAQNNKAISPKELLGQLFK